MMFSLIVALSALVEQITADPANQFEVRGPELRVRQTAGGPRLFRDGEMIRPRFAYVSFGTGATPIGADWTKAELPFVLPRSFARLQIQMRFPQPSRTGDVELRGFSIRRADGKPLACVINGSFGSDAAFAKTWRQTIGVGGGPALYLPQNLDREIGKVNEHPFPSKYADGVWTTTLSPWGDKTRPPDYTLVSSYFGLEADVGYVLSYEARSAVVDSVLPSLYSVSEDERRYSFIPMGTNSPAVSTLRHAAAAGVHPTLYCPPDNRYPEGEDWRWNDLYCDQLVKADPQVLLIPRLKIDAPEWWLKAHPDARMRNEKGEWISQSSVASREYREDTLRYLARFLRHMCERYPQNFGGIQPVGQSTSEWFYQGSQVKMTGYGPSTREAFRRWLKEHGRTGWETAEVPPPERRRAKAEGSVFVDSVAQADVLDFNRFLQDDMADFLGDVFALCRRLTKGKKLVYTFYGYGFEFLCNGPTPAATGHYGLQRLLDRSAADMDMMCAPISYINRGWIGTSINMGVPETVERAGLLWFDENDARTYLAKPSMADSGPGLCLQTKEKTMDVVRRDTSREILRNYGSWWMDLQGRGWWNDADIWSIIPETEKMERKMLARMRPFSPEVALIIDEESMLHVGAGTVRELGGLVHCRRALSLIGAPFGQYLLSDVVRNGLDAKFQIYLATWFGKVPPPRKGIVRLFVQVPGAPELSGLGPDDIVMSVRETIPGFYNQKSPEWKRPLMLRDLAEKVGVRFHLDRSEVGKAVVWASDGYVSVQAIDDGFRDFRKGECRFFTEPCPWVTDEERVAVRGRVCGYDFQPGTPEGDAKRFYTNPGKTEFVEFNYDEAKAGELGKDYTLEDPLTFVDGRKVKTAEDWSARRKEILGIFEREVYGRLPPPPDEMIVEVVSEKMSEDRFATLRTYRQYFRKDKSGPVIDWFVAVPRQAKGKVPVFLHLNYAGLEKIAAKKTNHYDLPWDMLIANGYAFMSAQYEQITSDLRHGDTVTNAFNGVCELWGKRDPKRTDNPGTLIVWAWGLMRGLDLAERLPEIDAARNAVIGSSRLGKAALLAAAFDERFKVCIPNQTGAVGVQLMKRNYGESLKGQHASLPHWYCSAVWKYEDDPKSMAFDQHLLLACVAPRNLLLECYHKKWFDPKGEWLAAKAASPVWEFLTNAGLGLDEWPEPYSDELVKPPFGYVRRTECHGLSPYDWKWAIDFANRSLNVK